MRILVTGGSGLVGWEILMRAEDWANCWFTYHSSEVQHSSARGRKLDIRNRDATERLIEEIDPDVIIHSAAMTDVDACEKNPDTARAINVDGVENVLAGATSTDSHVVFLSSSFVFDGSNHPHKPDDSHSPINVYGQTKADAEKLIEEVNINSTIVRTDQPYGWSQSWQSPTMVEWTLDQFSKYGTVKIFNDWYNTPTYLPYLANSVLKIANRMKKGIFHIVGENYLSRHKWALIVADIFGYNSQKIKSIHSSDSDVQAKRPNVYLENEPTINSDMTGLRNLQRGLEDMISNS